MERVIYHCTSESPVVSYGRNAAGCELIVHENQRQLRGRQLQKIDSNTRLCAQLSLWSRAVLRLRLSVCVSLGVSEHLAMCESHVSSLILSTFLAAYCAVCSQADCSLQRSRWSATVGGCYLLCIAGIHDANKRVFKESSNRTRTHQEMRQRTWTFVRRQHTCRGQRLRPLNRLANFYYKYLW